MVIQRSLRLHGWFDHIAGLHGGGAVEGLARLVEAVEGEGPTCIGPAEAVLDDHRIAELAGVGLVALATHGLSGSAVLGEAVTLVKPTLYDDPGATACV